MRLATMNWPQVKRAAPEATVLLPLGSTEQHGPHLAVSTDAVCATGIAERAEAVRPKDVLLCPTLSVGSSHHHLGFSGTLSFSPETYARVIADLVASVLTWGAQRVVLFNGHGGNITPVNQALAEYGTRNPHEAFVVLVTYWELAGKAFAGAPPLESPRLSHACEYETSTMLALCPEAVEMEQAKPSTHPPDNAYLAVRDAPKHGGVSTYSPFHHLTASGSMGDPQRATKAKGEVLVKAATDALVAFVDDFKTWPLRKDLRDGK